MDWWMWALLGLILAAGELATAADFYLLFLGVSAFLVAALAGLGVANSLWVQLALYGAFAILLLGWVRGMVSARVRLREPAGPVDSLVGQRTTAVGAIAAGGEGKVELRGANWNARNAGERALADGDRAVVERVDGLMLWVRPE